MVRGLLPIYLYLSLTRVWHPQEVICKDIVHNYTMTGSDNKRLIRICGSNGLLTIVKWSKREHGQASIPGIPLISNSEQFSGTIGFITNRFIVLLPSDNVIRSTVANCVLNLRVNYQYKLLGRWNLHLRRKKLIFPKTNWKFSSVMRR